MKNILLKTITTITFRYIRNREVIEPLDIVKGISNGKPEVTKKMTEFIDSVLTLGWFSTLEQLLWGMSEELNHKELVKDKFYCQLSDERLTNHWMWISYS